MGNVAVRLISLIMLLQSRPTWKAADLAEELGVSERTIHRYMGMLEELGIPLYSERGPYGGFALVRGYKLPPLVFTAEEATVLYMGANLVGEVWGQTYKDAVTAVTAKLDNVLPDDLRQEVASVQQSLVISGLAARDYRPWEPIIHTLRECIMHRHCVRLVYQSFALEETCRDIEPYALTFYGGLWYVVGFCRLRQAMRTFRVDRIQQVTPLKIPFTIPRDFSARDYITKTLSFEQNYTVVVHIAAEVAPHIRERYGHWMHLTEQPDGSVTARFGVSTLEWATGWVLSYGCAVRVLEPPELIVRVQAEAEAVLRQYG
ncbi:MAG TPA: YafY family protein [Anaerolineae bacterium]|nr:YafY family protein [Anaerolineae bacterium]HQK15530.1 YafY family protein [Anaerolineae bacterium]